MLFSKSCIYGIRAVIYLAVNNEREYVPIKEMAKMLGISFHFLTKILQDLATVDLVKSQKGANGGVGLKRRASEITVYDIVAELDGTALFEECILGLPDCSDENPCSLHKYWRDIKQDIENSLKAETLNSVAEQIIEGRIRLCDPPAKDWLKK